MPTKTAPNFLLASPDPALLALLEPLLSAFGAHVDIALSADSALALLGAPADHSLLLLDANLPERGAERLLAAADAPHTSKRIPIVLISDTVTEQSLNQLSAGALVDIVPSHMERDFWQVRIGNVLRAIQLGHDFDLLRESSALHALYDPLTGTYNRGAMLAMLFRETDRVQRMKGSLSMILFDVDDFGYWNSRLGAVACDDLLCQIGARAARLLRSYDLLGRVGKDEFLVAMPGGSVENATMLAERLRLEVFSLPFDVHDESVRLSACFGISSSNGRSPLVVLREAEQALQSARTTGPETIQFFGEGTRAVPPPAKLLPTSSEDKLLAQ
ncbi:MAG: GGDEF domain-containing protein [Terracidiphilus sp.]